jgi:hypothetical protein
MKFCVSLTLTLSLLLCPVRAQNPFAEQSSRELDLREAIFRYMFDHYKIHSTKIFCLQPDLALPERFLRRFADLKTTAVWASDCDLSGPMIAARYKKTGEYVLIMRILELNWTDSSKAVAKVEAFSDGIASNSNTLHLIRKDDRWIVKTDKLDAIS